MNHIKVNFQDVNGIEEGLWVSAKDEEYKKSLDEKPFDAHIDNSILSIPNVLHSEVNINKFRKQQRPFFTIQDIKK